ncbi:hypothetical protein F4604DRAFT_1902711 [Suillus subluteus]|nr:hypothetical protein F4604DRAFT_1902711 [Suillus subluteus]
MIKIQLQLILMRFVTTGLGGAEESRTKFKLNSRDEPFCLPSRSRCAARSHGDSYKPIFQDPIKGTSLAHIGTVRRSAMHRHHLGYIDRSYTVLQDDFADMLIDAYEYRTRRTAQTSQVHIHGLGAKTCYPVEAQGVHVMMKVKKGATVIKTKMKRNTITPWVVLSIKEQGEILFKRDSLLGLIPSGLMRTCIINIDELIDEQEDLGLLFSGVQRIIMLIGDQENLHHEFELRLDRRRVLLTLSSKSTFCAVQTSADVFVVVKSSHDSSQQCKTHTITIDIPVGLLVAQSGLTFDNFVAQLVYPQ